MSEPSCFGFFGGAVPACKNCTAAKRCKAILISHGFDVMADIVDQLVAELPSGDYPDSNRPSEQLQIMLKPSLGNLTPDQAALLNLIAGGTNNPGHTILD